MLTRFVRIQLILFTIASVIGVAVISVGKEMARLALVQRD